MFDWIGRHDVEYEVAKRSISLYRSESVKSLESPSQRPTEAELKG